MALLSALSNIENIGENNARDFTHYIVNIAASGSHSAATVDNRCACFRDVTR